LILLQIGFYLLKIAQKVYVGLLAVDWTNFVGFYRWPLLSPKEKHKQFLFFEVQTSEKIFLYQTWYNQLVNRVVSTLSTRLHNITLPIQLYLLRWDYRMDKLNVFLEACQLPTEFTIFIPRNISAGSLSGIRIDTVTGTIWYAGTTYKGLVKFKLPI